MLSESGRSAGTTTPSTGSQRPWTPAFALYIHCKWTSASAQPTPGHTFRGRTPMCHPHAPPSGASRVPATPTCKQGTGDRQSMAGGGAASEDKARRPSPRSPPPRGAAAHPAPRPVRGRHLRAAPRPWPPETPRSNPSARPTAAARARRAPNCRPGPTNAGRGGEVRAAGGACEPLGGRREEAARRENRGEAARRPSRNAAPGGTPLARFAPFP